jgi:hypothetical protein
MRDAARAVTLRAPNGTIYNSDGFVTLSSNGLQPFVFPNLPAGTSLSLTITAASAPCQFQLKDAAGTRTEIAEAAITVPAGGYLYFTGVPILRTGNYNLWIIPQTAGTTANVTLRFSNENGTPAKTVTSGQSISASFRPYVREYAKWTVKLTKGQDLIFNPTSATRNMLNFHLIKADSTEEYRFNTFATGSVLRVIDVAATGDYYIAIEKDSSSGFGSSASFAATNTIEP